MYDLIVCNPPYFTDSLECPDPSRNNARHNVSLTYEELFDCARKLLSETGHLAIIIPTVQYEKISALAKANNMFLIRQTNVRPTPNSEIKRYLLEFSPTEIPLQETDLTIELSRHNYTEEYKALTKDFYL